MKQRIKPKWRTGEYGEKNAKVGVRHKYMDQLIRKQCSAILKTMASMIKAKPNYKKIMTTTWTADSVGWNQKPKLIYYKNVRK